MPEEGAGCRFRIAQFIPYLQTHGFDVTLRTLFTPEFFRLVYQPGRYVRKTTGFARLSLDHLLEETERRLIQIALRKAKGNKSRAADLLSIWRPRLLRRMEALGIADTEKTQKTDDKV